MLSKEEGIKRAVTDVWDFYINSLKGITEKMTPADYLYLSERIFEFDERLDQIKKR